MSPLDYKSIQWNILQFLREKVLSLLAFVSMPTLALSNQVLWTSYLKSLYLEVLPHCLEGDDYSLYLIKLESSVCSGKRITSREETCEGCLMSVFPLNVLCPSTAFGQSWEQTAKALSLSLSFFFFFWCCLLWTLLSSSIVCSFLWQGETW